MDPPGGAPGPTPGDDSPDGQGSTASTPDPFAFGRAPNSPERPARPSGGASTSTSSPTHGSASMTRSRQGPPGQTRAHPTPSGSASAKSYVTLQGTPHAGHTDARHQTPNVSHQTLHGTPLPPTGGGFGSGVAAPHWAWIPKDGEVFAAADPGTCRPMMCDPVVDDDTRAPGVIEPLHVMETDERGFGDEPHVPFRLPGDEAGVGHCHPWHADVVHRRARAEGLHASRVRGEAPRGLGGKQAGELRS